MPKRQDPTHPLATAAAVEHAEITRMTNPPAPDPDPAPAPAAPVPDPTSRAPAPVIDNPAPTPPLPPEDRLEVIERRFDTLAGRFEKTLDENRELKSLAISHAENRDFVAQKLAEQQEANARLLREKRELEARLEAERLGRDFKSDVVDADQFSEIVRGMTPQLQRRDERIDELYGMVRTQNETIANLKAEAEKRVAGVRKEVTERLLLRDEPEFQALLARKDFQDFLAERIPGSRRTRLQEVTDAYNEGDTAFMRMIADDFRRRGNPRPVDAGIAQPPGRAIADQTPRAPRPEQPVTEDQVEAAYGQMLRGEITAAQYKAIRKRQREQEVAGR